VLELTVAAALRHELPSIVLDQPEKFANFTFLCCGKRRPTVWRISLRAPGRCFHLSRG